MHALGSRQPGGTATTRTRVARAFLNIVLQNKTAIGPLVRRVDFLSIQFREQNDGQCVMHFSGRIIEHIAHPYRQPSVIQSRSVVDAGKCAAA